MKCLVFSTDRSDQLILFRTCVSRNAASRGRAVLEGVGLSAQTIEACINSHPLNEEEAVQAGLTQWSGGQGRQPPTLELLIEAMEYAKIAQQHIKDLKEKLACRYNILLTSRTVCGRCTCAYEYERACMCNTYTYLPLAWGVVTVPALMMCCV